MNKAIQYLLILSSVVLLGFQANGQVLIAAEVDVPHSSAALEIRSDSGGLLLPSIELKLESGNVVATLIPNPADGLLVFHDGTLDAGGSSGLPRGLWYYDETAAGVGKWLIYSRMGSIYSSNLDNFGEMYESRAIGTGTNLTLNNVYSIPWASAGQGWLGIGFQFQDDNTVLSETGVSVTADQLYITTGKAYYTADISTTISTATSGNIVTGQLFVNDTAQEGIFFRHAFQTSGEYVNCATTGIIVLDQYDHIDFRFITSSASEQINIEHLNVKMTKIGDF